MKFIVISGIDGSGKTTLIDGILKRQKIYGFKAHYAWMRYNHYLVKPIHGLTRLIGLSKCYNTKYGKVWRHEFYKSKLFCSFYVLITLIDAWIGKKKLLNNLKKSKADLIICDRWILDIVIDLAVKTRDISFLGSKVSSYFFRLQPNNLKQFVVQRSLFSLLNCRIENQEDPDFPFRLKCYKEIVKRKDVFIILNNRSIEDAIDKVCGHLL